MSAGITGLNLKVADFVGLVNFNGTAKTKLAILTFLYCRQILKNSIKDPLNMYFLFSCK